MLAAIRGISRASSRLDHPLCHPGLRRTSVYTARRSLFTDWKSDLRPTGINPSIIGSIYRNPSVDTCYELALAHEKGTFVTSTGALAALSGEKTGRSPRDKRITDEERHSNNIWWGRVNIKLPEESFDACRESAIKYLNKSERLYVVDGFAGWDADYRLKIRVVCTRAYHALFMQNMLIRASPEELADFGTPDFTIFNAGALDADPSIPGITSKTSISISFERKEMVILGTEYAGEMKKGVFTVMHYLMPHQEVLSLHASANEGIAQKDVSLFFGLSGTGKTTLSADPGRNLIGDDEHCWSDEGIFNIEGGCYAKAIDLSAEREPEIFAAIRKGSVLENVIANEGVVDFSRKDITENTRACYPIEFIPHAKIPCVGGHPKNIILLTCDAFGVLPPVAKLTAEQAMYHFLSGYTAKIAGTEVGVKDPVATFSSCYGEPFLVWHPMRYAEMLAQRLKEHRTNVWLVNTGWTSGKYGVGKRISLKYSRAIVDAIHANTITMGDKKFPAFNLQLPSNVPGVPESILDPRQAWRDGDAFDEEVRKLAELFKQNSRNFIGRGMTGVEKGGPTAV